MTWRKNSPRSQNKRAGETQLQKTHIHIHKKQNGVHFGRARQSKKQQNLKKATQYRERNYFFLQPHMDSTGKKHVGRHSIVVQFACIDFDMVLNSTRCQVQEYQARAPQTNATLHLPDSQADRHPGIAPRQPDFCRIHDSRAPTPTKTPAQKYIGKHTRGKGGGGWEVQKVDNKRKAIITIASGKIQKLFDR